MTAGAAAIPAPSAPAYAPRVAADPAPTPFVVPFEASTWLLDVRPLQAPTRSVPTAATPAPDVTRPAQVAGPIKSRSLANTTLAATDREARYVDRESRPPKMAAGFALRVTNQDGTLAPQLGTSGPAGKILYRLAEAATDWVR